MIFRSPFPDVDIPDEPLHEFVLRGSAELGDKPALVEGPSGRTITHAELVDGVQRVAAGLAARGFSKADVLALHSPNLPEYAVAFLAAAAAGGTLTTINPLNTTREIAGQLLDSGARFLLTVPPLLDTARQAAADTAVEEIFVLGEAEGATSFASLATAGGPAADVDIDPGEDLVVLPYSSGTTGFPKGVMLTHRNLVANICQMDPPFGAEQGDVMIAVLPFFHIYGMVCVLHAFLWKGATVVTMPRFDLEEFLQLLERHRVTRAAVVPPIALALAKHPAVDRFDLSSLKAIIIGAAPVPVDVAKACAERLGCEVREGYGLTEASPVTHCSPIDPDLNRWGSAGPAVPNTEFKIVDMATGEALGAGERGELWVRGPQVMKGYLGNPQATADAIVEDGWLRTGDVARADEDGYVYLVDRAKELIKYKGYQVAPAELEALLVSHEAIAEAAVIPSPDEEAGEVPKAFVVASDDITAEEILAWVAEQVAPYKKIRRLEFVDEIPKSPSGKILRRLLVEREREPGGLVS